MKTNGKGLEIIKRWEGLRLEAYLCPAKIWTIGYGHTSAAGAPAVAMGMEITPKEAEDILARDLGKYESAVLRNVKVPLNANQFSALVSFTYNLGEGSLKKSTLLKKLNAGDYKGAALEFPKWNKAGGKVLRGLVDRRADEQSLFNEVSSSPAKKGLLAMLIDLLRGFRS